MGDLLHVDPTPDQHVAPADGAVDRRPRVLELRPPGYCRVSGFAILHLYTFDGGPSASTHTNRRGECAFNLECPVVDLLAFRAPCCGLAAGVARRVATFRVSSGLEPCTTHRRTPRQMLHPIRQPRASTTRDGGDAPRDGVSPEPGEFDRRTRRPTVVGGTHHGCGCAGQRPADLGVAPSEQAWSGGHESRLFQVTVAGPCSGFFFNFLPFYSACFCSSRPASVLCVCACVRVCVYIVLLGPKKQLTPAAAGRAPRRAHPQKNVLYGVTESIQENGEVRGRPPSLLSSLCAHCLCVFGGLL